MTRPTVTVRLSGGLGNQLFQYAAARRLAIASNAELVLDDASGFEGDWYQAKFSLHAFAVAGRRVDRPAYRGRAGRLRRRAAIAVSERMPVWWRRYIRELDLEAPRELLELKLDHDVYLEGGWMYDIYFADIREQLLVELDVPGPHDDVNRAMASRIQGTNSGAIHIRRLRGRPNVASSTPLPDDPTHHLSTDYYREAIRRLVEDHGVEHFFAFADYPEWAKEHLEAPVPITVVDHNGMDRDYEDFWLMKQCNHFVLANSTFGWWAAWLGQHPEKRVMVADAYVTPTRGLVWVPNQWERL
jgi:Glycosyl transferase family 11